MGSLIDQMNFSKVDPFETKRPEMGFDKKPNQIAIIPDSSHVKRNA